MHIYVPDIQRSFAATSPNKDNFVPSEKDFSYYLHKYIRESVVPVWERVTAEAQKIPHIITYSEQRSFNAFYQLIQSFIVEVMTNQGTYGKDWQSVMPRMVVRSLAWAFAGDANNNDAADFSKMLTVLLNSDIPTDKNVLDFKVDRASGKWVKFDQSLESVDIQANEIVRTDIIIPTVDTMRLENQLNHLSHTRSPLILCGPPGSGKSMILNNAIRNQADFVLVNVNFSSTTGPTAILDTLEQHCIYSKTVNGMMFRPKANSKTVILFCDEINLPSPDKYGTQRAIALLRQMIEYKGFWSPKYLNWISLERIWIIGACNPPSDVARHEFSPRFQRHVQVINVGYPTHGSLVRIYGTYNDAILRLQPELRTYCMPLTEAMVSIYDFACSHFTSYQQPHYIYSPRELTRWTKGIYTAMKNGAIGDLSSLVRIWAYEALRLFQDRLVSKGEKNNLWEAIESIARSNFHNLIPENSLLRPILYSNWMSQTYQSVSLDEFRNYVTARMNTFGDEEHSSGIVIYDDLLDHILRISRAFGQPQGHVILIGASGSGKVCI